MAKDSFEVRVWLLTGGPGIGKTTAVMETINLLKSQGYIVGGVVTRDVRRRGERVGFEIMDLATEVKDTLASTSQSTGPRLGRYRVNLKGVAEVGCKALADAVARSDLVVCDEIGPMELFSPEFRKAVKGVIGSGKPVLGVVHRKLRDPLVEELKSAPFAEVTEVTLENRETLPGALASRISKVLKEGASA